MRRRTERTCAMLTRFRRSPTSKAYASSNGQIVGVNDSAPLASESRIAPVRVVSPSGKHHASVPEASSRSPLVALPFIAWLAERKMSQTCSLSDFADFVNQLFQILRFAVSAGNSLGHGNPAERDPNRLALGNLLQ
jgi:hypothetical protein